MKYHLSKEDSIWVKDSCSMLYKKMEAVCSRTGSMIPSVPENGRYRTDSGTRDITDWVNGFWGGMMWQMYHATGYPCFKNSAENVEKRLDAAFEQFAGLHHDVGFMWLPTAVADFKVTGNEHSRGRGIHAAALLAGRYNPEARFIRAWNPHIRGGRPEACTGWMIVDTLMNIPLLFWAAKQAETPAFAYIAKNHADTAMKYILRDDGTCNHIVVLDPENGEFLRVQEGQGYSLNSAWSRGQAWGIYGFALCAGYTGKAEYLSAAKKIANYFIACTDKTGHISACDFRAPMEPFLPDTSACACAACGLLELAEQLEDFEREFYVESAVNILKAIAEKYANWDLDQDGVLNGGRGAYHSDEPREGRSLIFGDYFFVEALLRLNGKYLSIW